MARNSGWWALTLTGNAMEELSDADREHIADLIRQGFTSGEVIREEIDDDAKHWQATSAIRDTPQADGEHTLET